MVDEGKKMNDESAQILLWMNGDEAAATLIEKLFEVSKIGRAHV